MTSRDSLSILVTLELRERLNELSLASEDTVTHQGQKDNNKRTISMTFFKSSLNHLRTPEIKGQKQSSH